MKSKQGLYASVMVLMFAIAVVSACEPNSSYFYTAIKGTAGTPRFNLQFTNGESNDLDLYVKTPDGSVISYKNPVAQNGSMDIDCLCGDCPEGANENVYWEPNTAPRGKYKVWAQYFDPCLRANGAAGYILRIMDGQKVIKKFEGKLSANDSKSPVYTFVY